ncbi:Cytoplasmic tRNA 2-thiolation protein 2 [Apophysomyces ossiformis]|uniref:Cytoplasmic tRNA 2-thiolation protein 2 n=1 Tax=Apophysomyces ossiformis TaxID=679940 RepID=A0A8H7BR37_9FUNG|nr:Cytoplasmic tRNA 2-thiolation protein 2 [Apophysomyces ossiformis]
MNSNRRSCCKCKTAPATVLIRHAYYCQKCFLFTFVGKFRSILTKPQSLARNKGKILLACSGGPASIAMLNLTTEFMRIGPGEKQSRKPTSEVVVCHIDESALFEDQRESAEKLLKVMQEKYSHFPFICHRMEDVFSTEFTEESQFDNAFETISGSSNQDYACSLLVEAEYFVKTRESNLTDKTDQLKSLFNNISKNTAKEDLYWHIKMAMLVSVARRESCTYIYLADSATRQAIKMISMTAKGRGYSTPMDVGVANNTCFKDIVIIRPMKDMLSKEIGLYNRFCQLDQYVIAPTDWTTKMQAKSSIDRLTEGLERDFPSTVSTISRTASKLTAPNDMDVTKKCAICLMPRQSGIIEWRKRITVTDVGESSDSRSCANQEQCCGGGSCGSEGALVNLNQYLCYSCQVNLNEYKQPAVEALPPYTVQRVKNEDREERLRSQIQEFLLDDNDDECNDTNRAV